MCISGKLFSDISDKKIVFFDIDDTLLSPKIGVPRSAAEAVKKLRDKGNLAFICTGRSKAMIFPFLFELGFDGIIAGAGTYGEYNGEMLFRTDMSKKDTECAIKKLREFNFLTVPEGHDYLYYEKDDIWDETYDRIYGIFKDYIGDSMRVIPDNCQDICAAKISAVFNEKSRYDEVVRYFENDYSVINHHNVLLELIPRGYSKAAGIRKIIDTLGISWENTYAIGDSMNDYEMLQYVKCGIAMGNSDERIKEIADYVTDTLENDGVYKALEHFSLI